MGEKLIKSEDINKDLLNTDFSVIEKIIANACMAPEKTCDNCKHFNVSTYVKCLGCKADSYKNFEESDLSKKERQLGFALKELEKFSMYSSVDLALDIIRDIENE